MSQSTWTGSAILFDLDGTLVESLTAIERHTRLWAGRHGLDPDATLEDWRGRRDSEFIAAHVPLDQVDAEMQWMRDLSCHDVKDITAAPGTAELIAKLPAGSWGIVTSGEREVALRRLSAAGLPTPGVLVTAEDVEQGKPHPEGFLQGAALLGVDPQTCVVFEDAEAGAAAALAAGMCTVVVGDAASSSAEVLRLTSFKDVDAFAGGEGPDRAAALRLDFTLGSN